MKVETQSRAGLGLLRMFVLVAAFNAASAFGQTAPFTLVRSQSDICRPGSNPCVIETQTVSTQKASSFAEVGSLPGTYAKARADFGNNGGFASVDNQVPTLGAFAESWWVDEFTITGGVGPGELPISVSVNGTLSSAGAAGGPGPNAIYALYVSDFPSTFTDGGLRHWLDNGIPGSPSGSRDVIPFTEELNGSYTFLAMIPFTYSRPFYLASYFAAEVLGNGTADFYSSAHFGATAPDGTAITGSSGVTYALASSVTEPSRVPEPSTHVLLLVGLALLLAWRGSTSGRPEVPGVHS